jgi:1A family penicillin-binding protein
MEGKALSRTAKHSAQTAWLRRGKALLKLVGFFALLCLVGLIIGFLFLRTQSLPSTTILQTSYILDYHGDVIDSFNSGQNRQVIKLGQMSPHIVNATLAIEDHRFYSHPGIDLQGLARAIYVDIKHMAKVQGASTITQQLARNLYLNHDRTLNRKVREAMYAFQLEMQYDKDTILEMYLNQIYYGHSTYGVQAAARLFFGKDASELTLAESALLAGVPKGPRYYSPYYDEKKAKSRQLTVLKTMVNHGYITQAEADRTAEEPLVYQQLRRDAPSEAPYFTDYIKQLALDELGISEQLMQQGGIRIYTTLDLRMQQAAQASVAAYMDADQELQTALVAIDPRTGYVKAMVGGVDYSKNQFNRSMTRTRQPGSSFKPILYLAALATNQLNATTQYRSEPTLFTYDDGRETYMPSNFNDKYAHDLIDMRQAISRSDNIYAVQTIMNVGPEQVIEMARKLGIGANLQPLPSLALGTYPISPFEMASAFATIANQGLHVKPTAILRIEDSGSRTLYEAKPEKTRAVDAAYAYVLTNLMESVFDPGGTGSRVSAQINRPVAGKTGTTNSDAWLVGFTPELSTAVWVGHDQGRMISSVESHKAAPIFADFMEKALEPVPPKIFPIPAGVVSMYIDPVSGKIATADCPQSRLEVFVKGTEPVELCDEHGDGKLESSGEPNADAHEAHTERSWWGDLKRWWNE